MIFVFKGILQTCHDMKALRDEVSATLLTSNLRVFERRSRFLPLGLLWKFWDTPKFMKILLVRHFPLLYDVLYHVITICRRYIVNLSSRQLALKMPTLLAISDICRYEFMVSSGSHFLPSSWYSIAGFAFFLCCFHFKIAMCWMLRKTNKYFRQF